MKKSLPRMKSQAVKETKATRAKLIAVIWREKGKKGWMMKERVEWCLKENKIVRMQTIPRLRY